MRLVFETEYTMSNYIFIPTEQPILNITLLSYIRYSLLIASQIFDAKQRLLVCSH